MNDLPLFGTTDGGDNLVFSIKPELFGKMSLETDQHLNTPHTEEISTSITNEHNDRASGPTKAASGSKKSSSISGVIGETSRTPSSSSLMEPGISFLGCNLHQLSDSHISKLIRLRFGGNPLQLVRQLLLDLATKESELILLRRHSFVKEQELYKLCSEYGNLSALEVDQKLQSTMKKIDNRGVDDILLELIGNAMNEDYLPLMYKSTESQKDLQANAERHNSSSRTRRKRTPSKSTQRSTIKLPLKEGSDNEEPQISSLEPTNKLRSDSQASRLSNFGATATNGPLWLKRWFNSSDELNEQESTSSPSVLGNLLPGILKPNQVSLKPPLELNSFARENSDEEFKDEDYSPSATVIPQVSEFSVDKYGFYDSHNLRKVRKSISVNSDDQTTKNAEDRLLSPYDDSTHNSSSEHEYGEFSILNKPAPLVGVSTMDVSGTNDVRSEKDNQLAKVEISGKSLTIHDNSIQKLKHIGELHDLGSMEMERQWEKYLKSLEMFYSKSSHLIGVRGLNLVVGKDDALDYYNNNKFYRQLHDLVDKGGIPQKYRGSIWMELTGGDNLRVNGEFERYYQLSIDPGADKLIQSNLNQVDLDLHRTMPSNIYFNNMISNKPGPLYSRLKKILYSFVSYKPEIGYCQGMNKIVGNLLLGCPNLPEEDVYWIFVGLVEEILPRFKESKLNYFDYQSLESIRQDQKMICDIYFPKFMPKLHEHLIQNLGVQVEFITINWWLLLFTENFLTLDVWFKIFDNLLLSLTPETKLISLSLAVFKMFESLLFKIDNADDAYLIMKNLNHNSLSKMNLKYSELIHTCDKFERRIDVKQLEAYRNSYN